MTDELTIYNRIKKTIEGKIYFAYHAFIYIVVNLIIFILILTHHILPDTSWQVWILIGWGLALYFHFIEAFIFNPLNKQRWKNYLRKKGQEKSFIDFFYHLHLYIGINVFLLVVNKLTTTVPWSIYPFFFWGLGLIIHLVLLKYLPRKKLLELRKSMKDNELFEARIYFLTHFFLYLFFNLIIFVINFITMRGEWWFIYPLIGWGIGVFFHWVWIVLNKSHRIKRYKQKKAMDIMKKIGTDTI